jgi:hypothetical protein
MPLTITEFIKQARLQRNVKATYFDTEINKQFTDTDLMFDIDDEGEVTLNDNYVTTEMDLIETAEITQENKLTFTTTDNVFMTLGLA